MKFFVDNNLSPQLANGMKAFGEDVIHITEIFPGDIDDTEYLPRVGSEGWFLVTRDNRIRYRPAEQWRFHTSAHPPPPPESLYVPRSKQ